MNTHASPLTTSTTRRDFLAASSGALAGAIAARSYAGEQNTIKIALVGCGGRGTGAVVNAFTTRGPTCLYAMSDFFDYRVQSSLRHLSGSHADKVDVPAERRFIGIDSYKNAIDAVAPGGVAILASPPAFRPMHLEYAVARGCHVFMEKSFAVDAPGTQRVLRAGREAQKKNLKIVGGLMSRHYTPLEEAVARIHDGAIGEVITCWAYRKHGPVVFTPRQEGMS